MLMRMSDLSGSGSGGGSVGGGAGSSGADGGSAGGSGGDSGEGVAAHAANSNSANASANGFSPGVVLVTETDPKNIDLRGSQTAAQHVQFVQIVGRW
jgi:hypothetical protein